MTIVPRTSEGSASSAPLTTAWYQAGKSSDCLGSATGRSLSGRLRAASGSLVLLQQHPPDGDPPDGAKDDRGEAAGQKDHRRGPDGVGNEQGDHVDPEDDPERAEPPPGGPEGEAEHKGGEPCEGEFGDP